MDALQQTFAFGSKPVSPGRPTDLFWGATVVLSAASALYFLVVAPHEQSLGGVTLAYCGLAVTYAAVIGYCLWNPTWRIRLQRVTSKLIVLAVSIILSLCVMELAVRVLSPPAPFHPALALRPSFRMNMEVKLPGVSPTAQFTTNGWGLRGDEPPSDWREYYTIVTIGGSTTQCFYLDDRKTWPHLLQTKLQSGHPKVWVGNGGLDGHSTRSHLIFMREVISKIRPDAVIVLVGMNDFVLLLNETARLRGNGFDFDPDRRDVATDPVRRLMRTARFHSRILQLVTLWKQIFDKEVTVVRTQGHGIEKTVPLEEPPRPLADDLHSVLPQLDEYRANLKEIIEIGRSHGVRMIFLTQPLSFDDDESNRRLAPVYYWMKDAGYVEKGARWSAAQNWLLLQEYNRNLLELCRAENVECYDLASAIPHGDAYFYDAVHFNELGAELVAGEVSSFLEHVEVPLDK